MPKSPKYTFVEVNSKSQIWSHFRRSNCKSVAECKKCKAVLKCTGGSTKGLRGHCTSQHAIKFDQHDQDEAEKRPRTPDPAEDPKEPVAKQPKLISNFFNNGIDKRSVDFAVSRLAAVHAIPLNTIASSADIQAGFKALVLTGRADTLYYVKNAS